MILFDKINRELECLILQARIEELESLSGFINTFGDFQQRELHRQRIESYKTRMKSPKPGKGR